MGNDSGEVMAGGKCRLGGRGLPGVESSRYRGNGEEAGVEVRERSAHGMMILGNLRAEGTVRGESWGLSVSEGRSDGGPKPSPK